MGGAEGLIKAVPSLACKGWEAGLHADTLTGRTFWFCKFCAAPSSLSASLFDSLSLLLQHLAIQKQHIKKGMNRRIDQKNSAIDDDPVSLS